MNSIIENEAYDNGTNENNIEDSEDQASLISALSGEDADVSLLVGEEVLPSFNGGVDYGHAEHEEAATIADTTTLVSNTSSNASNYFLPHHKHVDSLCYSTTSSCDLTSGRKGVPTSSYLASFGSSLGSQQAFPSSMFPGQKLLPPTPTKHQHKQFSSQTNDEEQGELSTLPSYYYMSSRASYQNSTGGSQSADINRPIYSNAISNNVYQKRTKRSEFHDDDVSLPANWKGALRCFFSPRVLVTVMVCAVLLFNLLRFGSNHKHHIKDSSSSGVDYVKLETIGSTVSGSPPWEDSSLRSKRNSRTVPEDTPTDTFVAEEASKETTNDGGN